MATANTQLRMDARSLQTVLYGHSYSAEPGGPTHQTQASLLLLCLRAQISLPMGLAM